MLVFSFLFRVNWPYGSSGAADLKVAKVVKVIKDLKVRRPRTVITLALAP